MLASLQAGKRDRQITIESATIARDATTGAQAKTWAAYGQPLWAEVIESSAPGEAVRSGVASYAKPTRVRLQFRSDIDATMRVNLGAGRLLQIIGVAMLGARQGTELACVEWSHG